jgi:plastocyanin
VNRSTVVGSAVLIAAALTACSSDSGSSDTSPAQGQSSSSMSAMPSMSSMASTSPSQQSSKPAPAAAAASITIKDFAFTVTGKVSAGAKIMVRNDDGEAHTVTADNGGFDVTVAPAKTVVLTAPTKAGVYPFHCTFHSNMHGKLTVS